MWVNLGMLLLTGIAWATETENLGIRVLPAPGPSASLRAGKPGG